jgi:hypothetical protein
MKSSVNRVENQADKKQEKASSRMRYLRFTEEIDCHQLQRARVFIQFLFPKQIERKLPRQSLSFVSQGYLTSTPEPPLAGFDGVHGGVFSSLYEHHINKLSPTAMDWVSFGASRKFLRVLSGPISVTMNTVSNPVFRKRTCVLSTTADTAELAKITNIQQTRNV